jgi:hypothetical protein
MKSVKKKQLVLIVYRVRACVDGSIKCFVEPIQRFSDPIEFRHFAEIFQDVTSFVASADISNLTIVPANAAFVKNFDSKLVK